jgi:predicted adenine nucleotide alpha hydrolase (AANH) superfamily ATPase
MVFIETLKQLLDHVKMVETEAMELSKDSQMRITAFIEKHNLHPDDETLEAMQYQDIISQQLSATVEAIEGMQEYLDHFNVALKTEDEKGVEAAVEKLEHALARAKEKHSGFGGKMHHGDDDGIEFF